MAEDVPGITFVIANSLSQSPQAYTKEAYAANIALQPKEYSKVRKELSEYDGLVGRGNCAGVSEN